MKRLLCLFILLLLQAPLAISDHLNENEISAESDLLPPLTNRYMKIVSPWDVHEPADGNALIIFHRINSDRMDVLRRKISKIWDITDRNQPRLLAMLSDGMKSAYSVKPGTYKFMAAHHYRRGAFVPLPFGIISFNTGGVDSTPKAINAEVVAGKTYFVRLVPHGMGFRSKIYMMPVKNGQRARTTLYNISSLLPAAARQYIEQAYYDNSVLLDMNRSHRVLDNLSGMREIRASLQPDDGK